jgi:hypothetical protein
MAVQILLVGLERFCDLAGMDLSPGIVCQASDNDGDGGLDWMEIYFPSAFTGAPPALLEDIQGAFYQFLRARYGVVGNTAQVYVGQFEGARQALVREAAAILRREQEGYAFPLSLYHLLGPARMKGFPKCVPVGSFIPPDGEPQRSPGEFIQQGLSDVVKNIPLKKKKPQPPPPPDIPGRIIHTSPFVPLIVEGPERKQLDRIFAALHTWKTLEEEWDICELTGGAGPCALFHGPSGTGKTQAARRIASEMDRPLLVVNHQEILNKYIGDTEKAIESVFKAAEEGGYILLFDEADSFLFSRANAEHPWEVTMVNAVLQRMERTRTVIIFTTNLDGLLDPAVGRRLLFKVRFPPPGSAARRAIWTLLLPAKAPKGDIDFDMLAEVQLTGGEIKNAILAACIQAASQRAVLATPILMDCALEAASSRLVDVFEEERRRSGRSIGFQAEAVPRPPECPSAIPDLEHFVGIPMKGREEMLPLD